MSNRLYNKELKTEYIDSFFGADSTKDIMMYEFINSANLEYQYDKDLYAFNDMEISSLLYFLKKSNMSSLNKSVSIYKDYIRWCIVNGKRGMYENGENRFEVFQATENMKKYISNRKVRSKFLTKDELKDLTKFLINPIDQAFIMCLYEFINGTELHELRALTKEDVRKAKADNRIELTDLDGSKRMATISHGLLDLLEDVILQEEYVFNNGEGDFKARRLVESPYVFRLLYRKNTINQMASYTAINGKMKSIRKYTGYNFITPNSLKETRIIHEIVDVTNALGLSEPNRNAYNIAFNNINKLYDVELSYNQKHSIKQKYKQATKLKYFQ